MNAIVRPLTDSAPNLGLIPSPAILAFARDDASRTILREVLGAGAHIEPGGIEEATAYMVHDPSSLTVIVDLSAAKEPLSALDRLAENCLPNTRVVALGEINDIHFYRALRSAGVSEYLVKPLTADTLRGALAAQPVTRPEIAPPVGTGETIAVVGARGGVGATMVAVSLAWLSTERHKHRTVLADLDLTCGSASLALDVEPGFGLIEALASPDRIDALLLASAAARLNEDLYLLSAEQPLDTLTPVQPEAVERLVQELRPGFKRVILDIPRGGGGMLSQSLAEASIVVIVTDFSLAGARDTGRLLTLAQKLAPTAKRLVVGNRFGAARKGDLPRADIEKALGVKLACVIPEDTVAVPQALNTGKALPQSAPSSPAAVALGELSTIINGEEAPAARGLLARILKKDRP